MPAKRLPWFRVWMDATTHEKVRQLDDGQFRTWVELLDAASKQTVRGRFASRASAVSLVRRPPAHVAALIAARLIDEDADKRLTMHDWDEWQRWRKEDANGYGSEPEYRPIYSPIDDGTPAELLTIDPRTAAEQLPNVNGSTRDDLSRVAERAKKKEIDTDNATNVASRAAKPNRSAEVIDALRAKGIEPTMRAQDHAALKASTAPVEDIAAVYEAVFAGKYGDAYMQRHLCVQQAIGWIDGYRAYLKNGVPPKYPMRDAREQPRRIVDRTGVEN